MSKILNVNINLNLYKWFVEWKIDGNIKHVKRKPNVYWILNNQKKKIGGRR